MDGDEEVYDRWEIQRLKEMIPMSDLLMNLGFQKINPRTQRAACLLHDGKNETSFCWKKDYFNCFSCHIYGDKIDLIKIVRGYDFMQTIDYLSSLTGYRLESNSNIRKRNINNKNLEIPQFIVEKIMNQNYELMQIESFIKEIKDEISEYTIILCSIRNERNIIPEFYKSIEDRLANLDSKLAYWTFERNRLWKKQNK